MNYSDEIFHGVVVIEFEYLGIGDNGSINQTIPGCPIKYIHRFSLDFKFF